MRVHPSFCRAALPDESPTSFWSDISHRMGRKAHESARDIGTSFQKIADGDSKALAVLTASCGLPADTFDRTALKLEGKRTYTLAGELFPQSHLTRSRLYVCPECLQFHGVHGQARWQIEAMRICLWHGRMLVPLFDGFEQLHMGHDFARLVAERSHLVDGKTSATMPAGSDGLARYLTRRLDGVEPEGWLTSMPAYAAARSCEIVGLARSKGVHALWKDASDLDRHVAGAVGYSILSAGPAALRDFFRDLRSAAPAEEFGFLKVYGRVFDFVSHGDLSEAYEPMRAVLRDHLLETVAFDKGDVVLGKAVETRRLHSVRSIGVETGLDARLVRRRIEALGLVATGDTHLPNDRLLVDAQRHASVLARLPDLLVRPDAGRYLGVTHYQGYALDSSLIEPFHSEGLKPIDHLFLRTDLDGYLARLKQGAGPLTSEDTQYDSIGKAAQKAKCQPLVILQMLVQHRLRNIRLDPTRNGIAAIMVDAAEVKSVLVLPNDLLSTTGVRMELGCCIEVAAALISSKVLPSTKTRHPVNNSRCRMVPRAEVEAFKREFISLYDLAGEVGRHPRGLRTTLTKLKIEPDLDPKRTRTLFFRRETIAPLLDQLRT